MSSLTLTVGPHAFGDGSHPTTRGVLEVLLDIDPALFSPESALDMGAGSGILSIAIAKKFRCPVLAVDIAASAVEAIQANTRANGVEGITAIRADGFDHPEIAGPYDLIAMNILAEPLVRLAGAATGHLAPEGLLITSGIFLWQEGLVREAYSGLRLVLSARIVIGDWVTLAWQKNGW